MLWIIDVSNHQGTFDMARAAGEGYSAAICKATEGTTFKDASFDSNINNARNAGMIPGAYHFLRAGNGSGQASEFYARIAAHGGPGGFLCACDNEADASWADTVAFFNKWQQLTGGHPLIMYSGAWWWSPRGWNGASLTPYLWHSHYVDSTGYGSTIYEQVPESWWDPGYGGWSQATMLQFTSSATVAGRSPIDVNAYKGTRENLLGLTKLEDGGSMALEGYDRWSADSVLYMLYTFLTQDADEVTSCHVADGTWKTWPNIIKQRLLQIMADQAEIKASLAEIIGLLPAVVSITDEQVASLAGQIVNGLITHPEIIISDEEIKSAVKDALREGTG